MRKSRIVTLVAAAALLGISALPAASADSATPRVGSALPDITGLDIHLDAQSFESSSGGAAVSRLVNSASSAIGDAVQSNPDRSPTYVASSNINGKPAIRFAADSYLTFENSADYYLDDMTVFVVANASRTPEHGELFSRVTTGAPWNHNWYLNIEGGRLNYGWATESAGGFTYPQNKVTVATDTTYVITAKKSGNRGAMYLNGETAGTFMGLNACDPASAQVTLGGAVDSFIGDVGELLVYNRGLTDAETVMVEQYLESRWGMENLHEGMLTGISVKGEPVSAFRGDKTDYTVLTKNEVCKSDITFTKWYNEDAAVVSETATGFAIEVTGAATNKKRTYTVDMKAMNYGFNEIEKPSSNEVKLNDGFWSGLYKQYSVHTVNFMFDMFDKSKSFDNFDRVANGEKKVLGNLSANAAQILKPMNDRDVYNTTWEWIYEPWREGLIYEGIRAASEFITVNRSDAEYAEAVAALKTRLDGYVSRIYAAALKTTARDGNGKPIDGYFSTFNILNQKFVADESESSGRWHHDIYNYGCLAEAAVYWYNATGDTRLLFAATRFTEFLIDYINGRDGYTGYKVVPPHELPEEALQRLYELYKANPDLVKLMENRYSFTDGLSPKDRYYKLEIRLDEYAKIAASWITDRGNSEGRYNFTGYGPYAQDNVVYTELSEATGHAVRANLWYNGMAYIGNRQQNREFVAAAERIWRNITETQMYITGGTGSTHDGDEAYGGANDLPHDGYCETCASVGMAFFAQNMFGIFGEAEYADAVELEMYNTILGCLGLDGNSFYYTNPLVSDSYTRPMFSNVTPCCVPMYLKFFSELPEIIYAKTQSSVFVNQYISSSLQTELGGNKITVIQNTDMPNGNSAVFSVKSQSGFTLKLRVPSWAKDVTLDVNGKPVEAVIGADGYVDVEADGKAEVRITFGKEVTRVYQDSAEANHNMVAFRYGSFIYCAEEEDNTFGRFGNILLERNLKVPAVANTQIVYKDDMFAYKIDGKTDVKLGVNLIKVDANTDSVSAQLTLIPFWLRGNRAAGYMTVWLPEK